MSRQIDDDGEVVVMIKIIVYHGGYGCDTGCCGHYVEVKTDGKSGSSGFVFDHPDMEVESKRQFAERVISDQLGAEHIKDLDWDNCTVVDDLN